MASLIGMSVDVKGKNIPIDRDELTIGRSGDNTIPLNNPTVSGHHCHIRREGDGYVLKDLGSTNGTRVNAKDIQEVALKPKDLIQVGNVEFLFSSEVGYVPEPEPTFTETQVVVSEEPSTKPESFNNISPFGARQKDSPKAWIYVIIGLSILAVGVVIFFFFKLMTSG